LTFAKLIFRWKDGFPVWGQLLAIQVIAF
jgi:hypothetical protein